MALTGKKRVFADAVLAGRTNKEAAIAAGYSEKTAAQSGSRMAKEVAIVAHIKANRPSKTAGNRQAKSPPPAPPPATPPADDYVTDPKVFLERQMNDPGLEMRFRIDVAKALMPYDHFKKGEGGKKDQAKTKAEQASGGKFAASAPPKLVAAGGKKV